MLSAGWWIACHPEPAILMRTDAAHVVGGSSRSVAPCSCERGHEGMVVSRPEGNLGEETMTSALIFKRQRIHLVMHLRNGPDGRDGIHHVPQAVRRHKDEPVLYTADKETTEKCK